jgi:gliding motility-associated protein GldM
MSLPREPRQKMINMMYLVLTALLALNVSAEILNAFKTVNNSLEKTNGIVSQSTDNIVNSLKSKVNDPSLHDKAVKWLAVAQKVTGYSNTTNTYIQSLKQDIMDRAGGDPNKKSFKADNLDIATRLMVDKGKGKELLQKLTEYKTNVLAADPSIDSTFRNSLPLDLAIPGNVSKSNRTWERAYFHMVPTVAALTILSKFQNDIKTSENRIVQFLHAKVGEVVIQQDAFAAIAVANTTNALPNEEIEITAGVGGFSTKVSPSVSIDGRNIELGPDGAAHYKFNAGGVGSRTVSVNITYTDQNGVKQTIEKKIEYSVGQSNAAVQLDKMNVLFIGVENPVTVSGSGDVSRLKVSGSGGGLNLRSDRVGHYLATVNSETDDCTIAVTTPDGKTTPMKFRVRSIPDPSPRVGANESGQIPAALFKSQAGVNAIVKNFFYETQFSVTGFRVVFDGAGFDEGAIEKTNSGAAWNECANEIRKCRPGSFVTIDEIRAIGPDRKTRKLNPLVFELK